MNIKIYSDGSCNTSVGIGAWAALIVMNNQQFEISGMVKNTTNQAMELQAIISALDFLHEKKAVSRISTPLLVYTDSHYICHLPSRRDTLERNNFYTKKHHRLHNYQLIQLFYHYMDTYEMKFVKVKAHQKKGESLAGDRLRIVDKKARYLVRQTVLQQNN